MLKERIQELQVDNARLRQGEKANANLQLIQSLQVKIGQTDKHLRLTLDRLTEEHIKSQKLHALLQTKENQVVSCLEIAERSSQHLLKVQQENNLFKLDRFANEEFEANLSVLRHITMERL